MTRRRSPSPAGEHLLAAAAERVEAEAVASADPVIGNMMRREAARTMAEVTAPVTQDECAALGIQAGPVVKDGALTLRLQDNSYSASYLEAHAHKERAQLAADAGCLDLAMDSALTIRAGNSLERMLAHQLAGAHAQAMRLLASADQWMRQADALSGAPGRAQLASVEAVRMANAAARMMGAYQDGVAALARLRTGGQQTVTVQHVHVSDGGQAVVAGAVTPARRKRR